jgi:protein-S-isoprenylcysteine O-methyltransferase Ste14
MIQVVGEALYLAGLVFAESLRLWRRVERLRPQSTWHCSRRQSRVAESLVLGCVLLGIWLLPLVSIFTPWLEAFDLPLPVWAVGAGGALFTSSLALRWRAQTALGRQWSHTLETAEGQVLVTQGVYARLRHPIYSSLVLWAVAQPLVLQNAVAGFGGAVAVGLIWLVRVPREEAMMVEHFGEEYRTYMARTGRWLPKRP